jgi:hypothetical protein
MSYASTYYINGLGYDKRSTRTIRNEFGMLCHGCRGL